MNEQPLLPDDALMAYLDGEGTAETAAAIAADPARYAEKLDSLRAADRALAAGLADLAVPDDMALGELALGLADRATRKWLEAYVARHPHTARRLALLEQFLASVALPEAQPQTLGERVRVLLAQLAGADGPPLAFGLRGDPEGVYQAGDYQIVLETDTDLDAPGRRVLTGLLTGPGLPAGADRPTQAAAQLWAAADTANSAPQTAEIDDFGNFTFSDLESGSYELIVSVAAAAETVEIHVQHLQVT